MIWVFPLLLLGALVAAESYEHEVDNIRLLERQSNDGDLCFLWGHRVALLGNQLYFTHGNYTFVSGEENTPQPYLFSLALSNSTPVETFIPSSAYQRYSLPTGADPNIAFITEDTQTILWYNNQSLFTVFATGSDATTANEMSMFDTKAGTWGSANVQGSGVNLYSDWGSEASVSVPETGLSFSFGGDPSTQTLPGLVTFNASFPFYPDITWSNNTSAGSSGVQVPLVGESEMVYVPYGKEGVLLMMGGYGRDASYNAANVDMSQISVYDIASTSWFVVTASGAAPLPRRQFCAVVSAAPDQSSFQVTIFGGFDGAETDFEDVWVLTIPSFNWINVGSKNDGEVSATVNIGRSHHRCAIYNDAQMIVLGGSVREGTPVPVNETSCKSLYPPIRVLDTTIYTWKTSFDDSLKYTVPESVTTVIGGNGEGGATMSGPEKGFNFTALSTIFATPLGAKTTATNSPSPTPTPAPTSHTGAIAGGVVAGVAGLAILAGAAYFFIRRKRKPDEVKRNGWKSAEQARTGEPKYALVSGVKAEQTELPTYSRPPAELGENHRGGGLRSPIELSG